MYTHTYLYIYIYNEYIYIYIYININTKINKSFSIKYLKGIFKNNRKNNIFHFHIYMYDITVHFIFTLYKINEYSGHLRGT